MNEQNRLYIFTNSRKIREFDSKFNNELIPKSVTIAEFEKKAVLVSGRFEIHETYALVLMQQACASVKDANAKLKIPNEFFAFLKNNDYLFSFFKELAIQKKSIDDIKFSDIYADFEEHLSILEAVLAEYKRLLASQNLYDDIVLPEIYTLNSDYIGSFDEIILEIDGFLSEFEWEIFTQAAAISRLKIRFQTSKFNQKVTQKIAEISGISIDEFVNYVKFELNLSDKTLTALERVQKKREILTRAFALRSAQCAYAIAKVGEFVREGIAPEKIAVITPDESFSELLAAHDTDRIFNFAMGESFTRSNFFQILEYICTALNDNIGINLAKENEFKFNEFEFVLSAFGVSEEIFFKFKTGYERLCEFSDFKGLIDEILSLQNDEAVSVRVLEELFFIENLSRYFKFSLRQICEIFLIKLRSLSLDDVGGGKVSVMGALESRGMKFDGVVIVDFNDDLIPKRSVNEMFLNSRVRAKAGLISYAQRENLQRFYYEGLINEAKAVVVCYVASEEKIASRFLKEFSEVADAKFSDEEYLDMLAGDGDTGLRSFDDEITAVHDFFATPLSFSRLNTFLTCARKYYYAYILGIKPPKMPYQKGSFEFGTALHNALCEYYKRFDKFDEKEFKNILKTYEISPLDFEILSIKLEKFSQNEQMLFNEGWRIVEREKELNNVFEGVRISGIIDRIDTKDGDARLIDYKSGNFDKKSLQLPFYQALFGGECEAYYYDLKDGMNLVAPSVGVEQLQEEIIKLKEISGTSIKFERNLGQACRYCDFKTICKGEL